MSDADKKLTEIRERHERDVMWCIPSSIAGPQAHDDRAFLLAEIVRLRADLLEQASLLGMGAEREEKLLARVEVLERVREAALPHLFTPSMETGIALLKAVQEAKP